MWSRSAGTQVGKALCFAALFYIQQINLGGFIAQAIVPTLRDWAGSDTAPMLFLAVNAVLVGRDLDEMVAARHPHLVHAAASRTSRFVLGLVANLLLLVPLVNLLAPIIAAAMATHLFHQRGAGGKS